MTPLDQAIHWLQLVARDGLHHDYGPWQPEALDTLAMLEGHPVFEETKIAERVALFLEWLAMRGPCQRSFARIITDRLLEIRKEIEANG